MSFESDLTKALQDLAALEVGVRYALGPAVDAGAAYAYQLVDAAVPVRTGELKASGGWERVSAGTEEASAEVFFSKFYALWVDRGHAMVTKTGRVVGRVPGRRFFETVILANRPAIGERIEEEVARRVGI